MASDRIVVLGAGQAGGWAALTLRDAGFAGEVVLIGEEPHLPYERPPLSKGVLAGAAAPESVRLVPPENYAQKDVEFITGRARQLDLAQRTVRLEDERVVGFDRLIITTGCRVRPLRAKGDQLAGLHYLRTLDDSLALRADLMRSRHLLVVGGGWIGLEVAATARAMGLEVTVVEAAPRLCARSLSPETSDHLAQLHRSHGVDVRLSASVEAFEGTERVERAVLQDGTVLPVDCVVIGIGVVPNDEIAREAGLAVDNGIVVDEYARTSAEGVYAAGDVTNHPNRFLGARTRLETWENAQNQGIHAAKSLLGVASAPYDVVPWVWSDQYGVSIQLMGFPPEPSDATVLRGDPASGAFVAAFVRDGQLRGAVAFNQDRELKVLRKLMEAGCPVSPETLQLPVPELMKLAKRR